MVNTSKIWVRFLVVFLFHLIIKSFDRSYPGGPFELNLRSLVFSLLFISYGLLLWYLAESFDSKLHSWMRNPEGNRRKMIVITLFHSIFAFVFMVSLNYLYRFSDTYLFENASGWNDISFFNPELTVSLTIIYLVVFGFDSYSQIRIKLQEGLLKTEQLEKESILAQYQALKAQIEPHFLFNSLSVLSSLVHEDADLSSNFIIKLSKTLRYIIEKNEFHLVKLKEELEFIDAYFFLIKTRLDNGVFLENKLEKSFVETTFIPPATLQLLVENAVNHNKYNPENPLIIQIEKEGDFIVVRNNLNPREILESSTRQGLKNVARRYELISELKVDINKTNTVFTVKIPVLNQSDYERFNI
ncbi:MAG: sensor histidine kinase [Prolixibacteraceae bacterium]|jgi:two-component system, LytTR family, sensor kinase|nr:sensor histidine kinase [Prolixibacteraceae bacterium]MBT6004793.1 sensor histidine kinase [Prolixibacteraceae bacterium]MBT6767097.1 sensor histidine kinase [Prolixibacteraceae bacterium]MBT6999672.1 sensor histidine kinase [Prolixibacteraceae bacterium]MBT7395009.1 sensor histidine kinase [Prolixibacteraceae bacterium]